MKKIILATLTCAALFTGCATQTGLVSSGANVSAEPKMVQTQRFYFWGLGQEQVLNAADICSGEGNIAKVQSSWQPLDILLSTLTVGIYYPRTASVYCK